MVQTFLDRGYIVIAVSRSISRGDFAPSSNLSHVDGDIGRAATAEQVAEIAVKTVGAVDHLVKNAGFLLTKPFPDYIADETRAFVFPRWARLLTRVRPCRRLQRQLALVETRRSASAHPMPIGRSGIDVSRYQRGPPPLSG